MKRAALTLKSRSAEETRRFGARLGRRLKKGDTVLLLAHLGAGKTTFVQGVARGLGVDEAALSPTFVIAQSLEGRMPVHHLDFYRLSKKEILALGVQDYLTGAGEIPPGVTLIEWAERFPEIWPKERIEIHMAIAPRGTERRIRIHFIGDRYKNAQKLFGD